MPKTKTSFRPGQSGNPAGRPNGSRNKASVAVDALLDGEAEALTRKAIDLALAGDTVALRLCMERICPPRRASPRQAQDGFSGYASGRSSGYSDGGRRCRQGRDHAD